MKPNQLRAIIANIILILCLSSCTVRHCPTYSGAKRDVYRMKARSIVKMERKIYRNQGRMIVVMR